MNSATSSAIGPASSSRFSPISVNAPVNGKKRKTRTSRIVNEEGIRVLERWVFENHHSGQVHDTQDRRDLVEDVKAVGNPNYKLRHLSAFLKERNIPKTRIERGRINPPSLTVKTAQQLARMDNPEEEILFPAIKKEILDVLKWLHSKDSRSLLYCDIDLGLDKKELVSYIEYLDETSKAPNSDKRYVPSFKCLLPFISAKNKDKIRMLYSERPDVSDIIAQMWAHRIGVSPVDVVLFVHCLRVIGKKSNHSGPIQIPESNTVIGTHLPSPTLSTSPEPHSPLLSKCTPDNQGPARPTAALPYEPNYSNSISFLPSPESTPAYRAAVISERSLSPFVDNVPAEPSNIVSTNAVPVPQSPRGSAVDSPLVGIQDLPFDARLEKKELRTHSIPPIARLVTDSSSSSQINSQTFTPVPAVSHTASESTNMTEEDQLVDDRDDVIDMRTTGFHAGFHLPTATLTTALVVETPSMPSVALDNISVMKPQIGHGMADINTNADIIWIPPILKVSAPLRPSPLNEVTSPTTAQGLLDNISLYEGLLDDLLAMADAAAARSIG